MRFDEKFIDVIYRGRDLFRVLRQTEDSYHPDLLGRYFTDRRSYFIDFRSTTRWSGAYRDNVPVVYVPSWSRAVFFPMTIVHYGLGSIDRYFETREQAYLENVRHVASWLLAHCKEQHGYFDNLFREIDTSSHVEYYSNNSAMTQGQAISFLTRVAQHGLLPQFANDAWHLATRLYRNMILPLEHGGGTLYRDGRVYLCEYCRKDDHVVLNGWIYALFGLYDYCAAFADSEAEVQLQATLNTLTQEIGNFVMPHNNWSYYDNKGRFCSPTYQVTHINQLDALFRLTKREAFREAHEKLLRGNNRYNRLKYTSKKVLEKLHGPYRYVTDRRMVLH